VGPLSPDGWARQTFIADLADIFAICFLRIPAFWRADDKTGNRTAFASEQFAR
jgi:hypothetical protein